MRDLDKSLQDSGSQNICCHINPFTTFSCGLFSITAVMLHEHKETVIETLFTLQILKIHMIYVCPKGVQRQNEQRCEQEIQEIKRGIESGNIIPGRSRMRFTDEALDEQKHCIQISDKKVALATQAYDLVDEQICRLDQYMKKLESLRQEKEIVASGGASALNSDGITRSGRSIESSRGRRKKTKVVTPLEQPSMDFELPVNPNEPTYCLCNQVSWGEMIACDNPDCKIEWFHFQCVGLKEQHPFSKQ